MTNSRKLAAIGGTLAAIIVAIVLALTVGHHHSPTIRPVDGDKASDCWAHPDKNGHRHCATTRAPRFGYSD